MLFLLLLVFFRDANQLNVFVALVIFHTQLVEVLLLLLVFCGFLLSGHEVKTFAAYWDVVVFSTNQLLFFRLGRAEGETCVLSAHFTDGVKLNNLFTFGN